MKLTLGTDDAQTRLVTLVSSFLKRQEAGLQLEEGESLALSLDSNETINEAVAIAKAMLDMVPGDTSRLYGAEADKIAEQDQWLSFVCERGCKVNDATSLNTLNAALADNCFLTGDGLTLADLAVFSAISFWMQAASARELKAVGNLVRFYDKIQHLEGLHDASDLRVPHIDLKEAAAVSPTSPQGKKKGSPEKAAKKVDIEKLKGLEGKASIEDSPTKRKDQAKAKKGNATDKVAFDKTERPVEDPMRLDIRVGKVLRAWPHPEADKLYCEEVDIGEPKPRQIASGLRDYIALSEFEGRKVLVLANLKEKKLRGFPSHGMLLCGGLKSENGSKGKVELVEPSDVMAAEVGARVIFEGLPAAPPDAVLNSKSGKDPWAAVQPHLRIDSAGVAFYKEHKLVLENLTTPCTFITSSIRDGGIS